MTNCLKSCQNYNYFSTLSGNHSYKLFGTVVDIDVSKNLYICIIKIESHVRTFNQRDI